MKKKSGIIDDYKIFGSDSRGSDDVEANIKLLLQEKETAENLEVFIQAVSKSWKGSAGKYRRPKLSFADIEKRIEDLKPEIARHFSENKQKN